MNRHHRRAPQVSAPRPAQCLAYSVQSDVSPTPNNPFRRRKLRRTGRADDGSRTRDLELGKLALYQLSYVRVRAILRPTTVGPWRHSRPRTLSGVSARALLVTLAALALIGLLGFGLLTQGASSLEPGDDAPDADIQVLGAEETGSISDRRGDWLLANFWASWCTPCRDESPTLQRFSEQQAGDVEVLGINTQDLSEDALAFVDEFGLTYPMLRDPDTEEPLSDDYGATGLPESFLIDPEGRVAVICRGPITAEDLDEVILPTVDGRAPRGDGSICRTEP